MSRNHSLSRVRTSLSLACLVLASSVVSYSQQTTATLTGNVTDSTGAIVPGVTVKAISQQTNVARETTTNEAGTYSLPFLVAGDYTIEAGKSGFQSAKVNR